MTSNKVGVFIPAKICMSGFEFVGCGKIPILLTEDPQQLLLATGFAQPGSLIYVFARVRLA